MLKIISIDPPFSIQKEFVMLESLTISATLQYGESLKKIRPQVWTNALTRKNATGKWYAIDMNLFKSESDNEIHHFRATVVLTGEGNYEFTIRIGFVSQEKMNSSENGEIDNFDGIEAWKWAGGFGENGKILVHPPNNRMSWTIGPQAVEISPKIYVGNYIAASHAKELGFTAVLNMSIELEDFYQKEDNILYKKIGLLDGANNPIPASSIEEAVKYISKKKKKRSFNLILDGLKIW